MITLENKQFRLEIDPLGAQWRSLYDKEHEQELLWQGNPNSWTSQAPLLFPVVGSLKEKSYIYHGQLYSMDNHGFLRHQECRVVHQTNQEVTFELVSNDDTKQQYPFEFTLRITMKLNANKVSTKIVVLNQSEVPMYFNVGGHPGIKVDQSAENKLKFKLKKKSGQFLLEGPFVSGYQKFNEEQLNLNEIDLESTLILDQVSKVQLSTPEYNYTVNMKPTKYMAFWSPKNKETNQLDDVLCIEPWWGIGDCVDTNQQLKDKKGILKLSPNESKTFEFSLKIEKIIPPLETPKAIGPYSIFREVDNFIYSSGQLPINPKSNEIESWDIKDQTRQALTNVKALLEQVQCDLDNVIKTTVFLKNMDDFTSMNEVYGEFFNEPYPARSAIEVARLPKDALVEIEIIAKKK